MSNKIKTKLQEPKIKKETPSSQVYTMKNQDFNYLKSLDAIRYSVDQYLQRAQGEFLKMVSVDLGYAPEKDVQFSIDLKDDTKQLTVTELPKSTK